MALNVYGILAILLLCLIISAGGFFIYAATSKNKARAGNLVRTTFSGNPAVLTSALWGLNREFATTETYGEYFDFDGVNALHCDVPGGYGTYSSWLSGSGLDFRTNPLIKNQNAPLYWSLKSCTTAADCLVTPIACGPGRAGWEAVPNPAAEQCPANSYCSVCGGPPGGTNYCTDVSPLDVGTCIALGNATSLSFLPGCVFDPNALAPDGTFGLNVCVVNLPPATNLPPFDRLGSCSEARNWQALAQCQPGAPGTRPFYCDFVGNQDCAKGQSCTANWGSETGWTTRFDSPTPPGYTVSDFVCSGSVLPSILINTRWIAEGEVISTDGTNSQVEWKRVQNTYRGVGPSYNLRNGNTRYRDPDDRSWVYSDCRFVKAGASPTSRHASVSNALLGTSLSNPLGLDDLINNVEASQLLYVGDSFGTLALPQVAPYYASAWNLRSQIPNKDLERIWFYSIQALDPTPDALAIFLSNTTR